MYLAVLLYKDVSVASKPAGIPDVWPARTVDIGDTSILPDDLSSNDGWFTMYYDDFVAYKAQYQAQYNAWYAQYIAPTPQQIVQGKVISAKDFGEKLLVEIAADNVLAGATQTQVANLIANNLPLILMLKSGSLYTALGLVTAYPPDSLMTQTRLDKYTAELKSYLGIS